MIIRSSLYSTGMRRTWMQDNSRDSGFRMIEEQVDIPEAKRMALAKSELESARINARLQGMPMLFPSKKE